MKHAPRGRIKARPPLDALTHERQKCTAKSSRTGNPCQKWPINGGTVCRTHGGAAPQVKAAAEKRLEDLRPGAINYLDWLLNQKEYPSAGLGAARDVLDRNDGKPHESVDMNVHGQIDVVSVLRQRQAKRAKSLEQMDPSHAVETHADAR